MDVTRRRCLGLAVSGAALFGLARAVGAQGAPPSRPATPAPAELITEVRATLEDARRRFEARDLNGVLSYVSERYRSAGVTKPALREHLAAMFAVYDDLRARVALDAVQLVDGAPWVYTTGQLSGRLPLVGPAPVLNWQRQPEILRREGRAWRLFGFQD
jgi:hypothetical protein